MTAATKKVLEAMLGWDRQRIADSRLRNPERNYTDYEARQARAAEALASSRPKDWSVEIREHFRVLLEIVGEFLMSPAGLRSRVDVIGQGRLRKVSKFPDVATREAVIAAADEIGELHVLQRAGSSAWRAS